MRNSLAHKVLTYTEYIAVSGVFQTLAPYPLSTQRVCPPPHSPGGEEVGDQYFGRRQTLDWHLAVYSLYGLATRDFVADPRVRRSSGYLKLTSIHVLLENRFDGGGEQGSLQRSPPPSSGCG
jgi:hypothetical protein